MRTRLLEWIYSVAARHGGLVLGIILAATLVSAALIPGLKLSSSYSDLAPADHPEQLRYNAFLDEFGAANDFVVVLEGQPAPTRAAADLLAAELGAHPDLISDVYYRLDLDAFLRNAPLYADAGALENGLEQLAPYEGLLTTVLADSQNLASLLDTLSKGLRGELEGASAIDPEDSSGALAALALLFGEWGRWIQDPEVETLGFETTAFADAGEFAALLNSGGYLTSRGGDMQFLFIKPSSPRDDLKYLKRLDTLISDSWESAIKSKPDLSEEVSFAVTGLPAHILTDVRSVRSDVARVIIPSAVMVIAILLLGLRSRRRTALALITLACALVIAAGVMRLMFGTLNRVSVSFLAILFGIGIDFSIYLLRRTEEERRRGRPLPDALREALTISGRGILTGGLVTGLAFFSTSLVQNQGLAQMGQTAGIGVLITLAVTFFLLPVLILRFGGPAGQDANAIHDQGVGAAASGIRRPWLGLALPILLVPALLGVFAIPQLKIDYNILRLLPPHAESTKYQLRMQEESDFQMTAAFVTADSLAELRKLDAEMAALPEVARVVSISQFLPGDQEAKLAALQSKRDFLRSLNPSWTPDANPTVAGYATHLDNFVSALEGVEEAAFSTGNTELLGAAGDLLDTVGTLRSKLQAGGAEALARSGAFEKKLFELVLRAAETARAWADLEAIDESSLPPSLLGRFKSPAGRYAAYVYPSGSIWEIETLDAFVAAGREATPTLTGFPVTMQTNVRLMVEGLIQAMLFSLGVIVVLLAADFRSAKKLVLTLIPLAVGMLWLQAWIHATGQVYNLASVIGLPLLLGLGVVYGVHIVHRWGEDPGAGGFAAARTSGRAIALAGLTTIAGLGALTFSLHRGVHTFSLIILQGIVLMLVAALVVLPLLLNSRWFRASSNEEAKP